MPDSFPPLHVYVMAHPCPSCGAQPGQDCNAPRKTARYDRMNRSRARAGLPPIDRNPLSLVHTPRADAGARHRNRDVINAPWPEDRVPGKSYDTLEKATPAPVPGHQVITADPTAKPTGELRHETEIVWTEPIDRLDYVREFVDTFASRRRGSLRWNGPGRRVGYSLLAATAPNNGHSGSFTRRVFWVADHDRSEQPGGVYATGTPTEGVDPRTVAPGVRGWKTDRAWGKPVATAR